MKGILTSPAEGNQQQGFPWKAKMSQAADSGRREKCFIPVHVSVSPIMTNWVSLPDSLCSYQLVFLCTFPGHFLCVCIGETNTVPSPQVA